MPARSRVAACDRFSSGQRDAGSERQPAVVTSRAVSARQETRRLRVAGRRLPLVPGECSLTCLRARNLVNAGEARRGDAAVRGAGAYRSRQSRRWLARVRSRDIPALRRTPRLDFARSVSVALPKVRSTMRAEGARCRQPGVPRETNVGRNPRAPMTPPSGSAARAAVYRPDSAGGHRKWPCDACRRVPRRARAGLRGDTAGDSGGWRNRTARISVRRDAHATRRNRSPRRRHRSDVDAAQPHCRSGRTRHRIRVVSATSTVPLRDPGVPCPGDSGSRRRALRRGPRNEELHGTVCGAVPDRRRRHRSAANEPRSRRR